MKADRPFSPPEEGKYFKILNEYFKKLKIISNKIDQIFLRHVSYQ